MFRFCQYANGVLFQCFFIFCNALNNHEAMYNPKKIIFYFILLKKKIVSMKYTPLTNIVPSILPLPL